MSTRKNKGGYIGPSKAFQYILSIGYEMETSDITKLSYIADPYGSSGNVFLNTDTARKDIKQLLGEESNDPDIIARQAEVLEVGIYDKNGNKDKNSSFLVTNDISKTIAFNLLGKYCEKEEQDNSLSEQSKTDSMIQAEEEKLEEEKNKVYSIVYKERVKEGGKHVVKNVSVPIYFIYSDPKGCSTFTNVEWVMTYYKPNERYSGNKNKNVILETFMNSVFNLLRHVDRLEEKKARLCINNPLNPDDILVKEIDKDSGENKYYFGGPRDRCLYKLRGENLHYFQMHYFPDVQVTKTIEHIYITIQMTFATKLENMYKVLSGVSCTLTDYLPEDNGAVYAINNNRKYNKFICDMLKKLYDNIDKMFVEYGDSLKVGSKMHTDYKKFISENNVEYDRAKNALLMIFWKLFMYYNRWKTKIEPSDYFKNVVIFNFRHSNYTMYLELKRIIMESMKLSADVARKMIIDIVMNEPLLEKMLITPMIKKYTEKTGKNVLDKQVFKKSLVYKVTDPDYGEPTKSLFCYFNFFENPSETEDNIREDTLSTAETSSIEDEESSEISQNGGDEPISAVSINSVSKQSNTDKKRYWNYDWFIYAEVDAYSTQMELNDSIALVELRHFPRLLFDYMYNIADPILKKDLVVPKYAIDEDEINITQVSLNNLRRILDIYNKKHPKRSLTRKSRSRSNTPSSKSNTPSSK